MEQWNHGSPAEFEVYPRRGLAVNTFSGMERFGAAAYAKLGSMGTVQLVLEPYLLQSDCMNRTCCTGTARRRLPAGEWDFGIAAKAVAWPPISKHDVVPRHIEIKPVQICVAKPCGFGQHRV